MRHAGGRSWSDRNCLGVAYLVPVFSHHVGSRLLSSYPETACKIAHEIMADWTHFVSGYRGGGGFCTGNFSHEKISRRVYFAQWPEN